MAQEAMYEAMSSDKSPKAKWSSFENMASLTPVATQISQSNPSP
jgi:hypothetical protein